VSPAEINESPGLRSVQFCGFCFFAQSARISGSLAYVTMTTGAPPSTHRERKKQATRQAIHEAAFDLVDEFGLSGTTIEAISERAGVAPRTFWSYFASKEDAVIARDPEWAEQMRVALLDRPADEDAATALRIVLEGHVGPRLVHSERSVRRQQLVRREPHLMAAVAASFDEVERALTEAVAQRLGTDPLDDMRPALLVMAASGACRVAHQRWADQQGRIPFDQIVAAAFEQLADGVAPLSRKGRSR
jgi:AcrR family transcriptional regulator